MEKGWACLVEEVAPVPTFSRPPKVVFWGRDTFREPLESGKVSPPLGPNLSSSTSLVSCLYPDLQREEEVTEGNRDTGARPVTWRFTKLKQ